VNGQRTDRTRLETGRGLKELAHHSDGGLEVALFWHPTRDERTAEVALSVLD
jgi:hypothetical protein